MKVTFPHMGNMDIAVKTLFKELGLDIISPPKITKRTLELGVKNAPEFACLPLKINIGNFIEAIEEGADTIVMGGGAGPCRFGYYGEVERKILEDLGYDFEMIVLEPPQLGWKNFYDQLKFLLGNISWWNIINAWRKGWAKAKAVDNLSQLINQTRPYLVDRKEGTEVYNQALEQIDQAVSISETESVVEKIKNKLNNLNRRQGFEPLRVGMVGEIYVVLEPFTNFQLEKKLGERGIIVDRSIYLTDWIEEHLYLEFFKDKSHHQQIKEAAQPYLNHFVGGHGLESVGETVLYAEDGYDGVVHLAPFTCMPEIIADSILPAVSKDLDLPVLSISVDEQTGEAGFITRLEAFADLLARQRESKQEGQVV
ncbi:acyl-CoA dehydratase activase-related protein [Halanaerobaculum tunisiense]